MAPEEECGREMFVMIRWEKDALAVPLSQLKAGDADQQTRQTVEDWHYWVSRGYEF
jgi:calcium binding protein